MGRSCSSMMGLPAVARVLALLAAVALSMPAGAAQLSQPSKRPVPGGFEPKMFKLGPEGHKLVAVDRSVAGLSGRMESSMQQRPQAKTYKDANTEHKDKKKAKKADVKAKMHIIKEHADAEKHLQEVEEKARQYKLRLEKTSRGINPDDPLDVGYQPASREEARDYEPPASELPVVTASNSHLPGKWEEWFAHLHHKDKFDETFPIYSKRFNFVYCPIPKNACSQWKHLLYNLHGVSTRYDETPTKKNQMDGEARGMVRMEAPHITPKTGAAIMTGDDYKFMIVRNPVTRLLSGYLYQKNALLHNWNRRRSLLSKKKKKGKGNNQGAVYEASPLDFQRFVETDIIPNVEKNCGWLRENMNQHYRPQRCFCGMELAKEGVPMPYTYVGKFENMKKVVAAVHDKLKGKVPDEPWQTGYGLYGKVSFEKSFEEKQHDHHHAAEAANQVEQYYTPSLLDKVAHAFRGEIRAFGYEEEVLLLQKKIQNKNWNSNPALG